ALCKVCGKIDVEFKDEANDPYKVSLHLVTESCLGGWLIDQMTKEGRSQKSLNAVIEPEKLKSTGVWDCVLRVIIYYAFKSNIAVSKVSVQLNFLVALRYAVIMEYLVNISKRRAFWSFNEDILKINILKTNTRIHHERYGVSVPAFTKDHKGIKINTPYPEDQYAVLEIWNEYNILEDIKRGPYSKKSPIRLRMTKVIKGEFKKIKDVKVIDVPPLCDASLEVFNNEVSRLRKMDDDLFTYEVKVANIPCDSKMDNDSEQEADDDMGYDPSDVTMDHYTMKALWIYRIRGDDEVELTDEESSDDEDDIVEVFKIDSNIFDCDTPLCSAFKEFNYLLKVDLDLLIKDIIGFKTYEDYKDDWIYEWNKNVPWVDEKPWTDAGVWTKPTPVKHTCKPFNYKTRCLEWPTCSWKDDGYCNGGNLPGAYIIGNQLFIIRLEWLRSFREL
ncbi:hypothetical protein Tco_0735775, partial [Tanacetum coccineum]